MADIPYTVLGAFISSKGVELVLLHNIPDEVLTGYLAQVANDDAEPPAFA